MNIFKLVADLEKVDAELPERLAHVSRRQMFRTLGKASLAAAPLALASVFNKAYGFTPGAIEVLNFALTLEYLEDEFYKMAMASGVIPANARAAFAEISKHESQHVAFLKKALGTMAVAKPMFDFTAGGAFPDPFKAGSSTAYPTLVLLAHAFEDTGVRAYKGQAGNLMAAEDKPLLEYALQIHSVEARHAAITRRLLDPLVAANVKPWITGNEGNPPAVYAGEDNLVQGGVNIKGLAGLSDAALTEAFDEPLSKEEVLAIAKPFIK